MARNMIQYRGSLKSCNYGCSYCPFAKRPSSPSELLKDREDWMRFVGHLETQGEPYGAVMVVPYGEALIHDYYWEGLARLSRMGTMEAVGAQTNVSFDIERQLTIFKENGGRKEKLRVWATFHPEMTTVPLFAEQCRKLLSAGIRVCAGAVGVPENLETLRRLKEALPGGCCLWINRMDGLNRRYTEEEQQALLHQVQHLLLIGEDGVQGVAHGGALAPAAAYVDPVAGGLGLQRVEGAGLDAAAAAVALGGINGGLALHHLGHMDGAGLFAQLAALAQVLVDQGHLLAHNAHVVQVGLDAVVGAAAHGDLELVGQLDLVVAHKEALVDLLRQGVGVDETVLAGGTLAGDHGAHLGAGAAGLQTGLFPQELAQGLDVLKGHTLDLHGETGGHGNLAAAEALGRLGDHAALLRGNFAVAGNDTAVKTVGGTFVPQKAQALHAGDLALGDGGVGLTHGETSLIW